MTCKCWYLLTQTPSPSESSKRVQAKSCSAQRRNERLAHNNSFPNQSQPHNPLISHSALDVQLPTLGVVSSSASSAPLPSPTQQTKTPNAHATTPPSKHKTQRAAKHPLQHSSKPQTQYSFSHDLRLQREFSLVQQLR